MQKIFKNSAIVLLLVCVFVLPQVVSAAWWNPFSWGMWNKVFHFQRTEQRQGRISPSPSSPVFCTQDAKQCPDGSYVGRQGPKCEFKPCPTIQKETAPPINASPEISKQQLVGIWQASPSMAAGWSNRYIFFNDGKYLYDISQMDCANRNRGNAGFWNLEDDKLILTVHSETVWVGGSLKPAMGSCGTKESLNGAVPQTNILTSSKAVIMSLLKECPNKPEGNTYECISFNPGHEFYKFSGDPTNYGGGEIFNEPVFNQTADWKTYKNDEYGFEFKYPKSLGEPINLKDNSIVFDDKAGTQIFVYMPRVFNDAAGKPKTFENFINSYLNGGYKITDFIVGNIKSVGVSSPQMGDAIYVPLSENKILEIVGNFKNPIFNQILSTFKFTK